MNSRRDALKAFAVISAAGSAVQAQHNHEARTAAQNPQRKVQSFSPAEFQALTRLVDIIIPRTDTPGASDAGVQFLIDENAHKRPELRKDWRAGLKLLMAKPESDWVGLLTAWSKEQDTPGARFFQLAKASVVDGYYSTREGLMTELGWNANTFPKFDGCTHPEHKS